MRKKRRININAANNCTAAFHLSMIMMMICLLGYPGMAEAKKSKTAYSKAKEWVDDKEVSASIKYTVKYTNGKTRRFSKTLPSYPKTYRGSTQCPKTGCDEKNWADMEVEACEKALDDFHRKYDAIEKDGGKGKVLRDLQNYICSKIKDEKQIEYLVLNSLVLSCDVKNSDKLWFKQRYRNFNRYNRWEISTLYHKFACQNGKRIDYIKAKPEIRSFYPDKLVADGKAAMITVDGKHFTKDIKLFPETKKIKVNSITFYNDRRIRAEMVVASGTGPGKYKMEIGQKNGYRNTSHILVVAEPIPLEISSVTPGTLYTGQGPVPITVLGKNFTQETKVFSKSDKVKVYNTLFYGPNKLRAKIEVSASARADEYPIEIGTASGKKITYDLKVKKAHPVITRVQPQKLEADGSPVWLTVKGMFFKPDHEVYMFSANGTKKGLSNSASNGLSGLNLVEQYKYKRPDTLNVRVRIPTNASPGRYVLVVGNIGEDSGRGDQKNMALVEVFKPVLSKDDYEKNAVKGDFDGKPKISGITPRRLENNGMSVPISITGYNFTRDMEVFSASPLIRIDKFSFKGSRLFQAKVTVLPSAKVGKHTIGIDLPKYNGLVRAETMLEIVAPLKASVSSFSPQKVAAGSQKVKVDIRGQNFKKGTQIFVRSPYTKVIRVESFKVNSAKQITAHISFSGNLTPGKKFPVAVGDPKQSWQYVEFEAAPAKDSSSGRKKKRRPKGLKL